MLHTRCWMWTGATHDFGYGESRLGRKPMRAHRVSWTIANGKIPARKHVLHRCDVPACVNPDHLFIGTQVDNVKDCHAKGRHIGGHPAGEKHPSRKIDIEKALSLRGTETIAMIAKRFGVHPRSIFKVFQATDASRGIRRQHGAR